MTMMLAAVAPTGNSFDQILQIISLFPDQGGGRGEIHWKTFLVPTKGGRGTIFEPIRIL